MSISTPTLLPRPPLVPLVLPRAPQPLPLPLPKSNRHPGRMNHRRDLQQEMEDLSDEEAQLERLSADIRNRGFTWLVPIGRHTTLQEEKNDADDTTEETESNPSAGAPSIGENDSSPSPSDLDAEDALDVDVDLDASLIDMDEEGEGEGDVYGDGEMEEDEGEEFVEEASF